MSEITQLIKEPIAKPIIRTADDTDFKTVNAYQLHKLMKVIADGSKRPEATNIRRQFVNIAAIQFDFREKISINVKRFATMAAKSKNLWNKGAW